MEFCVGICFTCESCSAGWHLTLSKSERAFGGVRTMQIQMRTEFQRAGYFFAMTESQQPPIVIGLMYGPYLTVVDCAH